MDIFKLFGEIAIKNDKANRAIDDTADKAERSESKMSAAFKKIGSALVNAFKTNAPEKLGNSLDDLSKTVADQEGDLAKLKSKYQDLYLQQGKNSDETKKCAKEIEQLSTELSDNKSKLAAAERAADNFDKSLEDVGDEATDAKGKISELGENIKSALGTVGKIGAAAVAGIAAVGASVVAATESTREYRTAMGKLETAFTTSGHSAETATATYNSLVGVLGETDVAVEAANHLALLCDNEKELQTWTNICTGVYATFGDSLPIEGLTEAANETAKVGQVTGPLADALNWAGISEDAFNESLAACTTEQERQKLIMDTLNGVYDEASQKYQTVNGDIIASNEAQEKLTSAMATFGEKAEPIVTAVKNGLGDLLTALTDLVAGADLSAIETAIDSAFSWLIDTVVPAVNDFIDFVIENKDPIVAAIAAVAAGFAAWNVVTIIQGVIGAIKAWTIATEGMTLAQKLLNLAMNANPIGIIITLITALVAAFVVLWNNCEGFRNFFIQMWEGIKEFFAGVVEWVSQALSDIGQFFADCWEGIKEAWSTVTEFFGEIKEGVSEKFTELKENASEAWETMKTNASEAWESMKTKATETWEAIKTTVTDVWDGIKAYVSDVVAAVKDVITTYFNAIKNTATTVWNSIKNVISTVVDSIRNVITTVWNAIKNYVTTVINSIRNVISTVWNAIKTVISSVMQIIKGIFTGDWESIKSGITNIINAIKSVITSVWNAIKSVVSSVMSGIRDTISSVWNGIKNTVSSVVNGIKNTVSSVFNGIKSVTTSIWNGIKTAITTPIETAKNTISNIVETIKGFFSNMTISFPHIKLPHFSISPAGWKFRDLLEGSIPTLGISWYAKAMDNPMLMERPTIFGYNPESGNLQAGGEAGSEVVSGTAKLMDMIGEAVESKTAAQNERIIALLSALLDATVGGNSEMLQALLAGNTIVLNNREVARTVRQYA